MKYAELMDLPEVQALMATAQEKFPGKRLRPVDCAGGIMILRQPNRGEYKRFVIGQIDDSKSENAQSMETLLRDLAVHPDKPVLNQWFEEFPGIQLDEEVRRTVGILAGSVKEENAK